MAKSVLIARHATPVSEFSRPTARSTASRMRSRSGTKCSSSLAGGYGRVEPGDALRRRLQAVEAAIGDDGGDLGTESAEQRRLVRDDHAAGLVHRILEGVEVDGRQASAGR